MNNMIEATAGEDIIKGDLIVIIDGVAYNSIREMEKQLWEKLGYKSPEQCIQTIKTNIPEIIIRTSKYHKQCISNNPNDND
jgi:hypothetical protein